MRREMTRRERRRSGEKATGVTLSRGEGGGRDLRTESLRDART